MDRKKEWVRMCMATYPLGFWVARALEGWKMSPLHGCSEVLVCFWKQIFSGTWQCCVIISWTHIDASPRAK